MLELVDSFEDAHHFFIVTKWMQAGDLLNYLIKQKRQPLAENHVRKIILQAALGVQSLHKQCIIHRDLKLNNIMMSDYTEDAILRIGDLGSAIKLASKTETADFQIGTAGYIAPEVMIGLPYSFSCDIWGLGCLMHTMLYAQCPFWDDDKRVRKLKVCSPDVHLDLHSKP